MRSDICLLVSLERQCNNGGALDRCDHAFRGRFKTVSESYDVEQDGPDSKLGPMKRGGCRQELCAVRPDQVSSWLGYYKKPTNEHASPVYVENIIVRDIQLLALPKQSGILQLRGDPAHRR